MNILTHENTDYQRIGTLELEDPSGSLQTYFIGYSGSDFICAWGDLINNPLGSIYSIRETPAEAISATLKSHHSNF